MAAHGNGPGTGPGPGLDSGQPQRDGHAATNVQVNTSYSDRVKMRVQKSERLKRNVLEINLECIPPAKTKVDKETAAKLISKIGIDIKSQTEGY